ncbi:MAG: hypothetical protein ABJC26_16590 [Gemmatimonadaceae bacterium]
MRSAPAILLTLVLLGVTASADAQSASVQGDRRAVPDSANAPPHYPEMLKSAGVRLHPDTGRIPLDSATQSQMSFAALDALIGGIVRPDSTKFSARIACVMLSANGKEVEPDFPQLAKLTRNRVAVVVQRRCPPGFGSMTRVVTVDGKFDPDPVGEDPFSLRITKIVGWTTAEGIVEARVMHATTGTGYECHVVRDSLDGFWKANCVNTWHSVSAIDSRRVSKCPSVLGYRDSSSDACAHVNALSDRRKSDVDNVRITFGICWRCHADRFLAFVLVDSLV